MNQIDTSPAPRLRGADWVADFFSDVDAMDAEALGSWLSDDFEVRFGNAEPIVGKAVALENLTGFWTTVRAMRHEREEILFQGRLAVQMSRVTYTRLDGTTANMPVASHLRQAGEHKIDRLWVFIDMAPLFAGGS